MIQRYRDGVEGMSNRNDISRSLEELNEQNQDFDDDANDLWFLFGKEAKSRDEAIKTLKDDMDGILIYVCACLFWSTEIDITLVPGWVIICCSSCVCRAKGSGFKSKPRKSVGLLPESVRSNS